MIHNLAQAERACPNFFSKDAMRFFNSRIGRQFYPVADGAYFVTSERFDDCSARLYSVRKIYDSGQTETIGEFQGYTSRSGAHYAAKMAAKREQESMNESEKTMPNQGQDYSRGAFGDADPGTGILVPDHNAPSGEAAIYSPEYLSKVHGRDHA